MNCLRKNYVWLRNCTTNMRKANNQLLHKNICNNVSNTLKSTKAFNHEHVIYHNRVNRSNRLCLTNFLGVRSNKDVIQYSTQCRSLESLKYRHFGGLGNPLLVPRSLQPLTTFLYSTNSSTESKGDSNNVPDNESKSSYIPFIPARFLSSTPREDVSRNNEANLSLFQKFKKMYRDYWYVLIPVHLATSVCWIGGFYLAAKSGIDLVAIMEYLNISEKIVDSLKNALEGHAKHASIFAVTFALYKISSPLRYAVTLGGTTYAINYLKNLGYIKPMPKKDELKHLYKVQKDMMKVRQLKLKQNVFEHFKETETDEKPTRKSCKHR